jgi:hypothetical protein
MSNSENTTPRSTEWMFGPSDIQESSAVRNTNSMAPQTIPLVSRLCLNVSVEIFFDALEKNYYKCYLGPKTELPMVYVDDCIAGTVSHFLFVLPHIDVIPQSTQEQAVKEYLQHGRHIIHSRTAGSFN